MDQERQKMVGINFRAKVEFRDAIERARKSEGQGKSKFIREAIKEWMNNNGYPIPQGMAEENSRDKIGGPKPKGREEIPPANACASSTAEDSAAEHMAPDEAAAAQLASEVGAHGEHNTVRAIRTGGRPTRKPTH